MVAAGGQGAWAADCPQNLGSTLSASLTGALTFTSGTSTAWTFAPTGTTNLQPDGCNKDSVFLAAPAGASGTGGGTASRNGGGATAFPYQLQKPGAPWSAWGNSFASSSNTNGILVAKTTGNETPAAVQVRITEGAGAPSFPRAGTYSDTVTISRQTITSLDVLEAPAVETLNAQVTVTVPFHCSLTWPNGNQLVLNYTSFGAAPPDATITLNVQCNDTYKIGLSNDANTTTTDLTMAGTALGLSYTLELSGLAQGNPPELENAAGRTIKAIFNSAGESGDVTPAPNNSCTQASQLPGGCAVRSQTNTHYVVIWQ